MSDGNKSYVTQNATMGVKIALDSIVQCTSGITDSENKMVLGFLHKAIKPLNCLRALEDATIIYRICVVGDTRVKTENSYKYIKDLAQNEKIWVFTTHGLELACLKKQWSNGVKPVYTVKSKHHSITATETHPVLVHDATTNVVSYVDVKNLIPKKHSFVYEKPNNFRLIPIKTPEENVIKLKNPETWTHLDVSGKEKLCQTLSEKYHLNKTSVRNFLYGNQFFYKDIGKQILSDLGILDSADLQELNNWPCYNLTSCPSYVDIPFARLFGFLLGDGSVDDHRITFAESPDTTQNEYYCGLLKNYFGNCARYPSQGRDYVNYTTNNTIGCKILRDLGFITGAKNKRIPQWVYETSDDIKKAFIEGLADADGHIKNDVLTDRWQAEIELCNKELIEDIKELWTSIGLSSGHIRYRKKEAHEIVPGRLIKATETWTVYISNIPLKRFEKIESIEYAGEEEVFDIEVDHEKHNFIGNGVVLHNSRAPERRVFYVDVGNLPKIKAEQYIRDMMVKHKNKLVYDSATGAIRDDRKFMTMIEDYWMPRREGGRGTQIETLKGGENLGVMEDVLYFQKKLYNSLNVPVERLDPDRVYTFGHSGEVTREEVKFAKFVDRIRLRFSTLFLKTLEKQLILKQIVTPDEWAEMQSEIKFRYLQDNKYAELKDQELLLGRMNVLNLMAMYVGRFYSNTWVRKNLLKQDDEEIELIDSEIAQEQSMAQYAPSIDMMNPGVDGVPGGGAPGGAGSFPPPSNMPQQPQTQGAKGGKNKAGAKSGNNKLHE